MRLRLRLERNALPTTQALWPVKERKSTIAQLLQHINEVFPLEGNTWGLEDYKVMVGGFECLHYQVLEDVLKDDEEVTVKPLQWVDVRARTITGRNQISPDGRHMMDGVPFGRNMLTKPKRPDLVIPPRKRRRISQEESEGAQAGQHPLMENGNGLVDEDEDDEDTDDDFDAEKMDISPSDDSSSTSDDSSDDSSEADDSSDSDTDSTSSSDDSSSDDSDGAPSVQASKPMPNTTPRAVKTNAAPQPAKKSSNTQSSSATTGTKRKRGTQDESVEVDNSQTVQASAPKPGEGAPKTQERNARRRDSKRLKKLKEAGKLPDKATISDLHDWQTTNSPEQASQGSASASHGVPAGTIAQFAPTNNSELRIENTNNETRAGAEVEQTPVDQPEVSVSLSKRQKKKQKKAAREAEEMAKESDRQQLLSAIEAGGIEITEETRPQKRGNQKKISTQIAKQVEAEQHSAMATVSESMDHGDVTVEEPSPASTPRRSRLNVAGLQRMVFSSLGLRVPKTQEERDRAQEKLSNRAKRNIPATEDLESALNGGPTNGAHANGISQPNQIPDDIDGTPPDDIDGTPLGDFHPEDQDLNSWKSKIELTAVECCEEGITYSTPPFPFYQRWDAAHRSYKKKRQAGKTRGPYMEDRSRKKMKTQDFYETYDKYNVNGDGDALDYGDEEYWEEGALLDGGVTDTSVEDDGFPTLPEKLDGCAALLEDNANVNDFIAYTELACDESTNWQPLAVNRLAKIVERQETNGNGKRWTLKMSSRDRKARVFDEEGNRVYSKFEMPSEDEEDDAGDEGVREVGWMDLGEVKLVLKADAVVNGNADDGDAVAEP